MDYLHIGELLYIDHEDKHYNWKKGDRVFVTEVDGTTCYCICTADESKASWLNTKQVKILSK